MLQHLQVRNLGVLEDATIEPSSGLTVITGETGAGKTLLLGGLRLILGEKTRTASVGPNADEAQSDGIFVDGDGELGVTRVVPRVGKSRAFLEGSIVSAMTLSERVGRFVEIVGQHDQLSLRRPSHVLSLIDSALSKPGLSVRRKYQSAWETFREILARREMIGDDEMALRRELDLVRFQVKEIDGAGLETGEDVQLEAQALRLRNVEEIREHLAETLRAVDRMSNDGGEVVSRIRKIGGLDPASGSLIESSEATTANIEELGRELRHTADAIDSDPESLANVEYRLTTIGELKRKYGRTLDDVVMFGEEAKRRVTELETLLSTAADVEVALVQARKALERVASELTEVRREATQGIGVRAASHLDDMGLGGASLEFHFDPTEEGANGADRVELWFSSDARLDPGPVQTVASGGELSRLVLAVRLATQRPDTATLVFDEVDAGVGGETALALGRKLADLSANAQILCVTHLPQVAAFADVHYLVERNGAAAIVRRVTDKERLREISRMLAGLPDSAVSHQAAAELLETASR
jgi:DNA repair protein RecN (Recombination protein N)